MRPRTTKAFTLKFVRDDVLAPVTALEGVELLTSDGALDDVLDSRLFVIRQGAIVPKDVASLFDALKEAVLAKYAGQRIGVQVQAVDAAGFRHYNIVWLWVASK